RHDRDHGGEMSAVQQSARPRVSGDPGPHDDGVCMQHLDSRLRGNERSWGRALRITIASVPCAMVAISIAAAVLIALLGSAPRGEGLSFSTLVVDRDGRLLRPYTTEEGRWRLPATREHV